jgi:hypothetical protein
MPSVAAAKQWRCADCGRSFGRANQSHQCDPALSLEQYLAKQPAERRSTYEAVLRVLRKLGPVDIDPVGVGIMVKRARTFCELRPRRNAVELSFKLSEPLAHPRIRRVVRSSVHRLAYFVDLASAADVDAQIRSWLAESYRDSRE